MDSSALQAFVLATQQAHQPLCFVVGHNHIVRRRITATALDQDSPSTTASPRPPKPEPLLPRTPATPEYRSFEYRTLPARRWFGSAGLRLPGGHPLPVRPPMPPPVPPPRAAWSMASPEPLDCGTQRGCPPGACVPPTNPIQALEHPWLAGPVARPSPCSFTNGSTRTDRLPVGQQDPPACVSKSVERPRPVASAARLGVSLRNLAATPEPAPDNAPHCSASTRTGHSSRAGPGEPAPRATRIDPL